MENYQKVFLTDCGIVFGITFILFILTYVLGKTLAIHKFIKYKDTANKRVKVKFNHFKKWYTLDPHRFNLPETNAIPVVVRFDSLCSLYGNRKNSFTHSSMSPTIFQITFGIIDSYRCLLFIYKIKHQKCVLNQTETTLELLSGIQDMINESYDNIKHDNNSQIDCTHDVIYHDFNI